MRRGEQNKIKAVDLYKGRGVHVETIGTSRTIEGCEMFWVPRKVDIRLPGKGNSNFHGAVRSTKIL